MTTPANPFNYLSLHHRPIGAGAVKGIPPQYHHQTKALQVAAQLNVRGRLAIVPTGGITFLAQGDKLRKPAFTNTGSDPLRTVTGSGVGLPVSIRSPRNTGLEKFTAPTTDNNPSIFDAANSSSRNPGWHHVFYQYIDNNPSAAGCRMYPLDGLDYPGFDAGDRGTSASSRRWPGNILMAGEIMPTSPAPIHHGFNCAVTRRADNAANHILSKHVTFGAWSRDGSAGNSGENLGDLPYGTRCTIFDDDYATMMAAHPSWTPRQAAIRDAVRYYGIDILDGTGRQDCIMQMRADLDITIAVFEEIDVALERIRPYLWPIANPRDFATESEIHTDDLPYYGGGGPKDANSVNNAYDAATPTEPPEPPSGIVEAPSIAGLIVVRVVAVSSGGGGEIEAGYLNTINVTNDSQLEIALAAAEPGDDIVLANGTYFDNFTLSRSGTAANPIRIRASTIGGANMTGTLNMTGAYGRCMGLRWTGVIGGDWVVSLQGNFTKFQRNFMQNCRISAGAQRGIVRVTSPANGAVVEYNKFWGMNSDGYSYVKTHTTGSTGAINAIIRYNYFHDFNSLKAFSHGGSGNRAGTDHMSGNLFTFNFIENCRDNNLSSGGMSLQVKGSDIDLVQNTFVNSGYILNRHGYNNDYIANTSINSGGPLLCGKNHRAIGNFGDKAGTYTSLGASTGNYLMDNWVDGGSNQPAAENIILSQNVGPLNLQMWNSSTHNLNPRGIIIESHSGSIAYGSNAISRTPSLPAYITRAPTLVAPSRIVLSSSDVGPNAAGAPVP